jgi:hypothetical protein
MEDNVASGPSLGFLNAAVKQRFEKIAESPAAKGGHGEVQVLGLSSARSKAASRFGESHRSEYSRIVHCLGVAAGDVEFLHWEDPPE